MVTTKSKLDRVAELLDLILLLPFGHPDRLRFLTCAEQIFDEPDARVARDQESNDARSTQSVARS
jgi:hypothetical protein